MFSQECSSCGVEEWRYCVVLFSLSPSLCDTQRKTLLPSIFISKSNEQNDNDLSTGIVKQYCTQKINNSHRRKEEQTENMPKHCHHRWQHGDAHTHTHTHTSGKKTWKRNCYSVPSCHLKILYANCLHVCVGGVCFGVLKIAIPLSLTYIDQLYIGFHS